VPATRVKPAPVMEADFTVTAEVLDEVSVTVRVTSESTVTLPKLRLVVLSFNIGFSDALAGVDSSTP
jgi:hypothetical protein